MQATIVGHRGGSATHIRSHWAWTIPLPERLNFAEARPLLCGGITVFAPLAMYAKPTDRVGMGYCAHPVICWTPIFVWKQ